MTGDQQEVKNLDEQATRTLCEMARMLLAIPRNETDEGREN
jgi:hypothetical protein